MLKDAESKQERAFAGAIEEDRVKQQKECVPVFSLVQCMH